MIKILFQDRTYIKCLFVLLLHIYVLLSFIYTLVYALGATLDKAIKPQENHP